MINHCTSIDNTTVWVMGHNDPSKMVNLRGIRWFLIFDTGKFVCVNSLLEYIIEALEDLDGSFCHAGGHVIAQSQSG